MDLNNYEFRNYESMYQNAGQTSSSPNTSLQLQNQQSATQQSSMSSTTMQLQQSELQALQNSQAFKQLQKQIQKMRKYYLSIGYSQKQVTDMLHEILLRKQNQQIDWKKLANTSDYYTLLERYNSTSQIAESALKFKKEITQMKNICKNLSNNCNNSSQQKSEVQQEGFLSTNSIIGDKQETNDASTQSFSSKNQSSLFTLPSQNIFNHQQSNLFSGNASFPTSNSNNFLSLHSTNLPQIQTSTFNTEDHNQNNQKDKREKQKQLDINEISDRFLYRLDKNCSIERSSSSSESGDQDSYHYKINSVFIQTEHDIEQQQIKTFNQQTSNKAGDQFQGQSGDQANKQNNQFTKQKQTFSQNIKLNFPEAAQGIYGNNLIQHIPNQNLNEQSNGVTNSNRQSPEEEKYLDFSNNNDCIVNEDSYQSYSNETSIATTTHNRKKKIRKQKGIYQEQLPGIIDQSEILLDKHKKKICRGMQYRDDISIPKHSYAGKKRNHKFINTQFQQQDNNQFKDFNDLDDLQLLEKKFRYFTDDDQNSQQ